MKRAKRKEGRLDLQWFRAGASGPKTWTPCIRSKLATQSTSSHGVERQSGGGEACYNASDLASPLVIDPAEAAAWRYTKDYSTASPLSMFLMVLYFRAVHTSAFYLVYSVAFGPKSKCLLMHSLNVGFFWPLAILRSLNCSTSRQPQEQSQEHLWTSKETLVLSMFSWYNTAWYM